MLQIIFSQVNCTTSVQAAFLAVIHYSFRVSGDPEGLEAICAAALPFFTQGAQQACNNISSERNQTKEV